MTSHWDVRRAKEVCAENNMDYGKVFQSWRKWCDFLGRPNAVSLCSFALDVALEITPKPKT